MLQPASFALRWLLSATPALPRYLVTRGAVTLHHQLSFPCACSECVSFASIPFTMGSVTVHDASFPCITDASHAQRRRREAYACTCIVYMYATGAVSPTQKNEKRKRDVEGMRHKLQH
jgi:hypothetical protein